jgi:hypothetical protein
MNQMHSERRCELADELAAYLLGALEPERMARVRSHLPSCDLCRVAAEEWKELDRAAAVHRGTLATAATSSEEALAAFTRRVALAEDLDDSAIPTELDEVPAEPPLARAPRPLPRGHSRPWIALAATAAALAIVVGALFMLPRQPDGPIVVTGESGADDAVAGAGTEVEIDGVTLTLPRGFDLAVRPRWRLAAETGDAELAIGDVILRVAPGTRLRQYDAGPPPRLALDEGAAVIATPLAEATVVRLGELELVVPGGSTVSVAVDRGEGGRTRRVLVGVGDGGAILLDRRGGAPVTLAAGEAAIATATDGGEPGLAQVEPVTLAEAEAEGLPAPEVTPELEPVREPELLEGLPPVEPAADDDPLPPDVNPESVPPTITGDEAVDPAGGGSSEEPTAAEEEPEQPTQEEGEVAGRVEVRVMPARVNIDDTLLIQVVVHSDERGLGAYRIALTFGGAEDDLEVELVGQPQSAPDASGDTRPFTAEFRHEARRLEVTDFTQTYQGSFGSGEVIALAVEVRVLGGSIGSHAILGEVVQLVTAQWENYDGHTRNPGAAIEIAE